MKLVHLEGAQHRPLGLELAALHHLWYQNHGLTAPVIYLCHEPRTTKNKENKMWLRGCRIVTCFDHVIKYVLQSMLLWSYIHHTDTRQSFCHNIALKSTSERLLILRPTECRYRVAEMQGFLNTESKNQNIRHLTFRHKENFFPAILTLTKTN